MGYVSYGVLHGFIGARCGLDRGEVLFSVRKSVKVYRNVPGWIPNSIIIIAACVLIERTPVGDIGI